MSMHIPLIKRAKERGLYVLTCDYIKENEGHRYADEVHYDSTTDFAAVLSVAKNADIDAIVTFNSDPAALTVAYIAGQLGLPGNNYECIKIMSEKDLLRKFLLDNKFNVPKFKTYTAWNDFENDFDYFNLPVLIKPVDSSGSKGISIVSKKEEIKTAFSNAYKFSRSKRIIIEEYIELFGNQIHGDAFVVDGEIKFTYLGDHHFNESINNLVPYSTTFPSQHSEEEINMVKDEVQRFISLVGFKQGGINIEARISKENGKVYLIEVGPRNGGNFTPIIIQYATGFNFIDATLDAALDLEYKEQQIIKENGYFAYLVLHTDRDGIFKSISISPKIGKLIIEKHIYLKEGDIVHSFHGANAAIGVLLVKFSSLVEMNEIVEHFMDYYNIILV